MPERKAWEKELPASLILLNVLGYLPPVAFIILSLLGFFLEGVIAGLVFSLALIPFCLKYSSLKTVNLVFPIFFFVCIVCAPVFSLQEALSTYSGSLLWGAFAVMAFVSLARRNPFTLEHAKEQVVEGIWNTPSFIATNYLLTGIFVVVFLANTIICSFTPAIISLSVPFVLLFLALISTKILPGHFVPYYEERHSSPQRVMDLSGLTLDELFEGMVASFKGEETEGWNALIQYNITGEDGGEYYIEVREGDCSLGRGKGEKPDLIITINKDDWFLISEGKLDGTKAFMEGRMKVEGDLSHLFRMEKAFPTSKLSWAGAHH